VRCAASKGRFDPEPMGLLATAFDTEWDKVKKSGSPLGADDKAASTRELLAKRIIAMGRKGERDMQRLVDDALAHLPATK